MEYTIEGVNADGKRVKMKVEATSEQHCRERLSRRGIKPTMIMEAADEEPPVTTVVVAPRRPEIIEREPANPLEALSQMQQRPQVVMMQAPAPAAAPPEFRQTININTPRQMGTSGLGVAGLVMGIAACLVAWIPFIGLIAIPVAAIGLLLAAIGFLISLTGRRSGVGMPVAGVIACVVAIGVVVLSTGGSTAIIGAGAVRANETAAKVRAEREAAERNRIAQQPAARPTSPSRDLFAVPASPAAGGANAKPAEQVELVPTPSPTPAAVAEQLAVTNATAALDAGRDAIVAAEREAAEAFRKSASYLKAESDRAAIEKELQNARAKGLPASKLSADHIAAKNALNRMEREFVAAHASVKSAKAAVTKLESDLAAAKRAYSAAAK